MKDSQTTLQKERDGLHKYIVHEACHMNFIINDNSDGVLQLHNPFYIKIKEEILLLVAVECEVGYPIVETYSGDFREIRYSNLTTDELVNLHSDVVMNKSYSFNSKNQLV